MSRSNTLLADIDGFLQRTKLRESRLGRDVLRDPSFVRELRKGRVVRPQTEVKVRAYMASTAAEAEGEH